MKYSVYAKVVTVPAKTPTPCVHVSANKDALAKKVISEMITENALPPANARLKFNQNRSCCSHRFKNAKKTKNSVNAKDAMAPAKTPIPCAHVSANQDALAKKVISEMMKESALPPENARQKFNQNRS